MREMTWPAYDEFRDLPGDSCITIPNHHEENIHQYDEFIGKQATIEPTGEINEGTSRSPKMVTRGCQEED